MHTVWDHIILNFIFFRPQLLALAIIIIIRDESVLVYGKLFYQKSCSCPSTRTIRRRMYRYTYRMESTFLITDGFWGTRRLEWYTYCAVWYTIEISGRVVYYTVHKIYLPIYKFYFLPVSSPNVVWVSNSPRPYRSTTATTIMICSKTRSSGYLTRNN